MRRGICVAELPTPEPTPEPLFSAIGWAGVGATAVGIGMLTGAGVTSLGVAKNDERLEVVSDPQNAEFDATERDELIAKLEGQRSLGRILVLGGAGLTLAGVSLIVVDLLTGNKEEEPGASARLVPLFLPDGGGLVFTHRF